MVYNLYAASFSTSTLRILYLIPPLSTLNQELNKKSFPALCVFDTVQPVATQTIPWEVLDEKNFRPQIAPIACGLLPEDVFSRRLLPHETPMAMDKQKVYPQPMGWVDIFVAGGYTSRMLSSVYCLF